MTPPSRRGRQSQAVRDSKRRLCRDRYLCDCAVCDVRQYLRIPYDAHGGGDCCFIRLLSAGHAAEQENAENRHADDSKDLCVYLDDRHGFAAAVLTKYSCMQRPRGVKQHLWVFVSLQVLISVRKCVWFSRDMYSILIKRRKGLCCNILFKLFIFAICISVCYSKKEWFRIQTKIRGNDI